MQKYNGRFFDVIERNKWEFVERHGLTGIVGIIAITDDNEIVLIKQYREPFQKTVIEIPAGLVGDKGEVESAVDAAKRELFEETGYEAETLEEIGTFCVSPGLTTEALTYVLATNLKQTGDGGGDESEQIEVFRLPVASATTQLLQMAKEGEVIVDAKIFTSLVFAYPVCGQRFRANQLAAKKKFS